MCGFLVNRADELLAQERSAKEISQQIMKKKSCLLPFDIPFLFIKRGFGSYEVDGCVPVKALAQTSEAENEIGVPLENFQSTGQLYSHLTVTVKV